MRIVDDSVPLVDLLYLISTLAYLDVDLWQKSIAKILVCYLKIDLPLQKVYM